MVDPLFSSEELYAGHGWRLTLDTAPLPDGRVKSSGRAHRSNTVHILAFPTDDTVLLLREFRPFYGRYVWLIPSGKADKEQDVDAAAQRELREETGFRSKDLRFYCMARYTDALEAKNHIYIARQLVKDPLPQDESELIEVHEVRLQDAIDRVLHDDFAHLATAYALLRYERERGKN
ncbi:MAG: NUDIX hydrolase [Candidatus Peribacteraceae bacterium]|nr:NUDIX hydrolase [Candidatus Peribacteraceae bacterium]